MNTVIQRMDKVKEEGQTALMELCLMMITNQIKVEVIFLQGEEVVQEQPVEIQRAETVEVHIVFACIDSSSQMHWIQYSLTRTPLVVNKRYPNWDHVQ